MVKARGSLRKRSWTPEEDWKLIAYISSYGITNWSQVPKYAGLLRCGKSCRFRWMNYLRPDIRHGNFSEEEEETIMELHEQLGNRWSKIASRLPGRTDNEIKNYWYNRSKKGIQVPVPSTYKPLQVNQTASFEASQQQNIAELDNNAPKGSNLDINKESPISPQVTSTEIVKIPSSEVVNNYYGVLLSETFDELHCFWEQPFTVEGLSLSMTDGYDTTHTDPGFLLLTPLWGLEE